MHTHTLDPMLLSPEVSDNQRKMLLFHEIGHLAYECNDLYAVIKNSMDRESAPATLERFKSASDLSHQLILMSKRLFGTVAAMNDFLKNFSLRQTPSNENSAERAQYLTVAGAALMHDLPGYDTTADWLRQWFKVDEHASTKNRLFDLRYEIGTIKNEFDLAQKDLYQQPEFYVDSGFRNLYLHRFLFREVVAKQIHSILKDVSHNTLAAKTWGERIAAADIGAEPNSKLQSAMIEELIKIPSDGMSHFRTLMMGQSQPNGEECSTRLSSLLAKAIHYDLDDQGILDDVTAIAQNTAYMEGVLIEDISDALRDEVKNNGGNDDEPEGFDRGPKAIAQISKVFKALELSDEQLTFLALLNVSGLKRGKISDLQKLPLDEQFLSIMRGIHYNSGGLILRTNTLKYTFLAAITKSLSESVVAKAACGSDHVKATCYALTGNALFLRGLQDKKLQDSMLGKDLGL